MKKFEVFFEVYNDSNNKNKELVRFVVEAGTKKLATLRAIKLLNDDWRYKDHYKALKDVKEVIQDGTEGSTI